jgi:8-oxo-dGTP pyrophosphatase MutT (NUDIX family)/phosphohistidine phosphatase SixA
MDEAAADDEIRAAGAVVWRPSAHGREIALIHRSRYDDWTFPKGKLEPGEHVLLAAVREVAEETGLHVILGRPLPTAVYKRDGRPKRVRYWAGRPETGGGAAFEPNEEADGLDWLTAPAAGDRLTYPRDAGVLADFAAGTSDTVPLVFLRHASAGSKAHWSGNDLDRPLDARGAADADRLAGLLACFGSFRVITSAAERCVATVRPYAAASGAPVEIELAFTVRPGDGQARAAGAVAEIVAAGQPTVICAHGENLPALLTAGCAALGTSPPEGPKLPKSAFWVLHTANGALIATELHSALA